MCSFGEQFPKRVDIPLFARVGGGGGGGGGVGGEEGLFICTFT